MAYTKANKEHGIRQSSKRRHGSLRLLMKVRRLAGSEVSPEAYGSSSTGSLQTIHSSIAKTRSHLGVSRQPSCAPRKARIVPWRIIIASCPIPLGLEKR